MVQAGKTAGQTKLSFAIKSETIDEVVSYFSSFVLRSSAKRLLFQFNSNRRHCMKYAKIRAFSDTHFPVYGQNLRFTEKYAYDSVHIRENTYQRKSGFWGI